MQGGAIRTGKSDANVVIQHSHLPDCSRVLQLQSRLLLDAQHHNVRALHADLLISSCVSRVMFDSRA
jgi:hypothetical protein